MKLKIKRIFIIACVSLFLCISCTKDEPDTNINKTEILVIRDDSTIIYSGNEYAFARIELLTKAEKKYSLKNEGDVDVSFRVMDWSTIKNGFSIKIGNNEEGGTIILNPGQEKILSVYYSPSSIYIDSSIVTIGGDNIPEWVLNFTGTGKLTIDSLTPPSWIQGTWFSGDSIEYNFFADNVIYSHGTESFSVKDSNENWSINGILGSKYYDVIIGQVKYQLYKKNNGELKFESVFEKLSDTTLNYINEGNILVLEKQK